MIRYEHSRFGALASHHPWPQLFQKVYEHSRFGAFRTINLLPPIPDMYMNMPRSEPFRPISLLPQVYEGCEEARWECGGFGGSPCDVR